MLLSAHSKFPPGLRLLPKDYLILIHVDHHRGQPYDQWPDDLKMRKAVEKLRRRGYIHRSYWPTKYTVTRRGFALVQWLKSFLEHVAANTPAEA